MVRSLGKARDDRIAMKKSTFLITGILVLAIGLIGWQIPTNSQSNLPKPNPNSCLQSVENEIFLMRNAWNQNLESILAQEKPTSGKVDEAFESLRTYRCWLNYLCEAVLFSGNADKNVIKPGTKLDLTHVDQIAGCISPNNLVIPNTQLKFMPLCQAPANSRNVLEEVQNNFTLCRQMMEIEFAGTGSNNPQSASGVQASTQQSGAFASLERALKTDSGNQKGRIIGNKLRSILLKMHGMEAHIIQLREQIEKFNMRLPCFINQCD